MPANKMYRFFPFLFFLCFLSISACGVLPDAKDSEPEVLPTPSATADSQGFQAVGPASCLIANWSSMQTDKAQGNLIAWQPDTYNIAYLAPQTDTAWFIGKVSMTFGPDYSRHVTLVDKTSSIGDVTWSPDGQKIAFLALRLDESIQTAMVVNADGSGLLDLFPYDLAQSDSRTSQKAILGWRDANRVRVAASCGEDCEQPVDINVSGSALESTPASESTRKYANQEFDPNLTRAKILDGLEPDRNIIAFDMEQYPKGFDTPNNMPNWSPDGKQVVYLDRKGLLWLLDLNSKQQYILDLGLRIVYETKWSDDGKRVAVRAEDKIFIFEVPCMTGGVEQ